MFELVDENGNIHEGPFYTMADVRRYVADRGLGEERSADADERAGGWEVRTAQ